MRILGCGFASSPADAGDARHRNRRSSHESHAAPRRLPHPVLVGIEAIGPMQWFLKLLQELGIACQLADASKIRVRNLASKKHDRRDAELILSCWSRNAFRRFGCPARNCSICVPCYCTDIRGCVCARRFLPLPRGVRNRGKLRLVQRHLVSDSLTFLEVAPESLMGGHSQSHNGDC
jgi:hypothetical protein